MKIHLSSSSEAHKKFSAQGGINNSSAKKENRLLQ